MKRSIALLLALLLVLSGCKKWDEPAYVIPGDVTSPQEQDPDSDAGTESRTFTLTYYPNRSLNPFQCTDYTNRALFSLIYQGLFAIDSNYKVTPMLCSRYQISADMRTWTFYLEQATFSDGTPVTPEDVRASLQASMGSPWYGSRLQHVQSITILGEAIILQLDSECESLPMLLDIPIVKASQVNDTHPLGTGPYRLDGTQLRRQAAWWCSAQLAVDAQIIPLVDGTDAIYIRNEFEAHHISLVCTDTGDEEYVDYRRDFELWKCENGLFLYLTVHKDSALFKNDAIRTALTHLIDRDMLISEYYRSMARSASLPASPQSPWYSEKLAANYAYAPEKFTEAVTTAQAQGSEITLLVCSGDLTRTNIARKIADALRQSGLVVKLKAVSSSELLTQLRWGKYDLFLGQTRLSANMDLSAFFSPNGTLNYGGLANQELYKLCQDALVNEGNYYTLHRAVMDSGYLCPILFQSYAIYGNRGVTPDLAPARDNIFYYDLGKTMSEAKITG